MPGSMLGILSDSKLTRHALCTDGEDESVHNERLFYGSARVMKASRWKSYGIAVGLVFDQLAQLLDSTVPRKLLNQPPTICCPSPWMLN